MNVFRRRFLQGITVAGAGAFAMADGKQSKSVTYNVKGFTCVTCAVGLEVMLRQEKGVLRAHASYPRANVQIEFDPHAVSEQKLHEYIADMGFRVQPEGH